MAPLVIQVRFPEHIPAGTADGNFTIVFQRDFMVMV